jgi:hypothetical protein
MLPPKLIPISDDPVLEGIKRAAYWKTFNVLREEKQVFLFVHCHYFKADPNSPDGYGQEVTTKGLKPFERTFVASNVRHVNPMNGKICEEKNYIVGQDAEGKDIYHKAFYDIEGNEVPQPMGQYDFFEFIIMNVPVLINGLIQSIIFEEDKVFNSFDN